MRGALTSLHGMMRTLMRTMPVITLPMTRLPVMKSDKRSNLDEVSAKKFLHQHAMAKCTKILEVPKFLDKLDDSYESYKNSILEA